MFFLSTILFFNVTFVKAQEKIILQDLEPTFEEEEADPTESEREEEISNIKSKVKKKSKTKQTIVKLRALDKITAKTSDIDIVLGKKNIVKLIDTIVTH